MTRVTAFLEQLPEVRLALTPVVSSRDIAEIQRRDTRPSADSSALPRAAIMEHPIPASAGADLAKRRLETVRTAFKQAGIDSARFTEATVAERTTAETQIELEILEPEGDRPSKVRQVLHRLGVPLKERVDD